MIVVLCAHRKKSGPSMHGELITKDMRQKMKMRKWEALTASFIGVCLCVGWSVGFLRFLIK